MCGFGGCDCWPLDTRVVGAGVEVLSSEGYCGSIGISEQEGGDLPDRWKPQANEAKYGLYLKQAQSDVCVDL